MKRLILLLVLGTFVAGISSGQNTTRKNGLPILHTIKQQTLSPPYSCRPTAEFQEGYQQTALFLSEHSKEKNSPDLLFNGACRSEDHFDVSTGGDDMSLIADLGTSIDLSEVTAHSAFNLQNIATPAAYSKFTKSANVALNHSYAVLVNKSDVRGLFIFTVVGYEKNKKVELEYAVKNYQILNRLEKSEGFDWEKKSTD
jgi:hypothetical protein